MQHQTAEDYLSSLEDLLAVTGENTDNLPVVVLVSEGERFDQAFRFRQLKYEPVIVPTIPYTERSEDAILLDTDDGDSYIPAILNYGEANGLKAKVRSLRMSWVFALDISPVPVEEDTGGGIIICERRAVPLVDGDTLYDIIKKTLDKYPDTEVLRLFHTHSYDKYTADTADKAVREFLGDITREDISSELPAGKNVTRLSPECDGSYAVFVRTDARHKVSDLLRNTRMPVDTAFEYAAAKGKLKVRTLNVNAFIRDGGLKEPCPGYKYCVQLSSYGRPMQLLSQIVSIKDQLRYVADTSRVMLHIVVRGCDKLTYEVICKRADLEFRGYKYKVVAMPNRAQLINFVEAPRGFDFYLKMDDDDFYDPLYLATTMGFHDKLPHNMCSTMSGGDRGVAVCMRADTQDRSVVRMDRTGACENTLVFSACMIDHLLRIASNTKVKISSGKASDAVPMRTISNSKLGLNRYEYWRFASVLRGRNTDTFSILNYEGSAHATGMSNFGAFASTAGDGAAEYYIRVFDPMLMFLRNDTDFVRESFNKFNGIDVAIVTDLPNAPVGMYVPMSTKWCTMEIAAAQIITDIDYDDTGAFVSSFKFGRTNHKYIYEPVRGLMVLESMHDRWKEEEPPYDFYTWINTVVNKAMQ